GCPILILPKGRSEAAPLPELIRGPGWSETAFLRGHVDGQGCIYGETGSRHSKSKAVVFPSHPAPARAADHESEGLLTQAAVFRAAPTVRTALGADRRKSPPAGLS